MDYMNIEAEDYAKLIEGRDVRIIQADIINWITHMKDTAGLSPASIKLYAAGGIPFLRYERCERLNTMTQSMPSSLSFATLLKTSHIPGNRSRLLLDKAEPRNRAIILLLSSSGMRVGALQNLKVGDLTPIDKYNIYQIQVYKRSKSKYITY